MTETSDGKERVIAYIDGFNLYFGLKESGFSRYYWLNLDLLVRKILKPNQTLVSIKYFTSLITNNVDKRLRQRAYLDALSTIPSVKIYYGYFKRENLNCSTCNTIAYNYNEKMTDVNIATQILNDYHGNGFDTAMLISGDTDLIPPTRLVNESPNNKRVFVAFPPNRINDEVKRYSSGSMVIGRKTLADSQFVDQITTTDGIPLLKPLTWV